MEPLSVSQPFFSSLIKIKTMMKLPVCAALAAVWLFVAAVTADDDMSAIQMKWTPAVGSGQEVTGGLDKPIYDWTVGQDAEKDLMRKIKLGNVYVRLHGKGEIVIADNYWMVGTNTTIDGTQGEITIRGPKGFYLQQVENVVIKGLCFKENETAVNMSAGGDKVWVEKCTFIKSAWGSPIAYSGWNCDGKPYGHCDRIARALTVSSNKFTDTHYGPLMYFGVGEATFYRNVWRHVYTRIPRAQNQGLFHVCNNVFDAWHLGLQGDDGARFIYERNLFNRATGVMDPKKGHELGNKMFMNPKERIDVCWRENVISGDLKGSELTDGPEGGVKVYTDCDAVMGRPDWVARTPCAPMTNQLADEIQAQAGAGDWCQAD